MAHGGHGGGAAAPKYPRTQYGLAAPDDDLDLASLEAVLAGDRAGQREADAASLMMQAGQSFANQRQAPREQRLVDDGMREWLLKRNVAAQDAVAGAAAHQSMEAKPADDPNSSESQAARAALLQTPTGKAIAESMGDGFAGLSAAQLKPYIPMYRASGDLKPPGQQKASEGPPDEVDVAELTKRGIPPGLAKTHGEALDLIGRHDSVQAQKAARAETTMRITPSEERARVKDLEDDVQKLGNDLEAVGQMKDDLAVLGDAVAKGVPGFGPVAGYVPDVVASDEAIKTRQAAKRLMAAIIQMRSGTAASDREVDRLLTANGLGANATETAFKEGVTKLREQALETIRRKEAKYRSEVKETYRSRGGVQTEGFTPPDLVSEAAALEKGTVRVRYQGKTLEIPRARLADALADGALEVK